MPYHHGVWGWGGRGGGGVEREISRSYAVSAPADQDASQLYYSYHIIRGGGGGGDAGERVRWMGEREIQVVVTQCLLLRTRMHHSYITHAVSWWGGAGGGGGGGGVGWGCWGKVEVGG